MFGTSNPSLEERVAQLEATVTELRSELLAHREMITNAAEALSLLMEQYRQPAGEE